MIRFLEWTFMVILPAGCAVLITIGIILHLMGQLDLIFHLIAPSRRSGSKQ